MLNTSRRLVECASTNDSTSWYVLKTSWRYLCKTSWRRLEDIFKTSRRVLEDVLKTFCKTSWRRFEEVLIWNLIREIQIPRPANSLGQLGSSPVFIKISPSPGFLLISLIFPIYLILFITSSFIYCWGEFQTLILANVTLHYLPGLRLVLMLTLFSIWRRTKRMNMELVPFKALRYPFKNFSCQFKIPWISCFLLPVEAWRLSNCKSKYFYI